MRHRVRNEGAGCFRAASVFDGKERARTGSKNEDDWDPDANQDQTTDPETHVSQNGDVHSSMADDEDREGK